MKSICKDITGCRFGRLTAIERADKPIGTKSKKAHWLFKCDCGNTKVIVGSSVRNGKTQSCGCVRNEAVRKSRNKAPGYTARHALYLDYKYQARRRGIYFDISEYEFNTIIGRNCKYCGKHPSQINKQNHAPGVCIYNGIDRVNNDVGYITENTVPCCKECNFAKSNRNIDNFMLWIKTVYEHNKLDLTVEQRHNI